jgi:hypothetical protein
LKEIPNFGEEQLAGKATRVRKSNMQEEKHARREGS